MASDPYIQREDERDWDDRFDDERLRWERADRAAEKGSVSPQEARTAIAALEPDSSPVPGLAFQGTPREWPRLGFWRWLGRVLWWVGFFALAWILALACAVALFEAVAWFMDGP